MELVEQRNLLRSIVPSGLTGDRVQVIIGMENETEAIHDYSVNGRLMRTSLYPRYERIGDKLLPKQVLIIDELNEGERTQMTMSEATTQTIPDSVFTKRYLESVNN